MEIVNSIFDHIGSSKIAQKIEEEHSIAEKDVLKQGRLTTLKKQGSLARQTNSFLLTKNYLFYLSDEIEKKDDIVYFKSKGKIELEWIHNHFFIKTEKSSQKERYFFKLFKNQKMIKFEVKNLLEYESWRQLIVSLTINNTFFNDFKVISVIGRGSSAKVYEVRDKKTFNQYACKCFKKKNLKENSLALLINEIRILKRLQGHPNILQFISLFESENSVYLITELCLGGRITKKKMIYSNFELSHIAKTLIHAVDYMSDNSIVHRDLKPDNILLKYKDMSIEQNEIKIIDFGLAVDINREREDKRIMGTIGYMAPELFINIFTLSSKIDIYSIGVILYNALTGTKLFADKDSKQMILNNKDGKVDFDLNTFKIGDNDSKLNSKSRYYKNARERYVKTNRTYSTV